MRTAPGLSVHALIEGLQVDQLSRWIGPQVLSMIRALSPDIGSVESLRELAKRMTDPASVWADPAKRSLAISFLPIEKARELSARLGMRAGPRLYEDLEVAIAQKSNEHIVRSFFGVLDSRTIEQPAPTIAGVAAKYGLFTHQRAAARRVHDALSEAPYKVLLHMPTGSGKTRTAMHVACEHLSTRASTVVVWLASNKELLEQAAEEFHRAWSSLGNRTVDLVRFWGSHECAIETVHDGIVIAGLAKLNALMQRSPGTVLALADRATLTIFDEAHQAVAPTYRSLASTLSTKRPRSSLLGLSATPGRTWAEIPQDAELAAFFEQRKVTLEVEGYDNPVTYLIDEGFLARADFRVLESTLKLEPSLPTSEDQDYSESVLEQIGADTDRNLLILREVEALVSRHRRVIVFAASVQSAQVLAVLLHVRGIAADAVTGETESGVRDRAIRKFRGDSAEHLVLCNYGVLTTGFDAPATSAALIARPTRSLVLYSQMVGRATRGVKAGGNAQAEIVTVVDPELPGFGSVADAFFNWEDVWE